MDDNSNKTQPSVEFNVSRTWIFFEEIKIRKPLFEIVAKDYKEAFELACKKYGPKAKNLYYCVK